MAAIMEPKQASTPGDTLLPRAQAVHVTFFPMVYLRKYTVICSRGKDASPEVLSRLCSTIPSMKTLDHANTHLLLLCPDEARAANTQR